MDADTMGLDACRDELARMEGWKEDHLRSLRFDRWYKDGQLCEDECGITPCVCRYRHPIGKTLDAAFAAIPKGWDIVYMSLQHEIGYGENLCEAEAENIKTHEVVTTSADTLMLAVFRLAVKIRRAQ